VILTLKDQGVLDEGGDVLVNVNMVDDERYKKVMEYFQFYPYPLLRSGVMELYLHSPRCLCGIALN
jgi:hypothetical protein